jgi:tetratricopeptide (TPR) repeat protein
MPSATAKAANKRPDAQARSRQQESSGFRLRISRRQAGYGLIVVACVYAFLAGFHTISETDLGWHMATGRYILQHHVVPTTDVLSYTSPGAPWIYPVLGEVLFYLIYHVAGYAGLSWLCALTLLAVVALLLPPPSRSECLATAALIIVGMPLLAFRMNPRPDLFTHFLFAVFLVLLWRFYRDEDPKAVVPQRALWLLPLLMVLWVNVHGGFIAGIAVICGYLLLEIADLADGSKRPNALKRLLRIWPVIFAILVATLLNPFGVKIYQASLGQASLSVVNLQLQAPATINYIAEFQPVPLSPASLSEALDWRNPNNCTLWWMAIAAIAAMAIALRQRRFGPATLLALALFIGFHTHRYGGLFAIVVVVTGGSIFADFISERAVASGKQPAFEEGVYLGWQAVAVVVALLALSSVRWLDLISNRTYILNCTNQLFGAGESPLFPERAAEFILHEHLPGNIFQPYDLGGFTAFRLGPAYKDYIDGRNPSPAVFQDYEHLSTTPVDSPKWEAEADRRGINIVLLSLERTPGQLAAFCRGRLFRPIYLDEVSVVLLRNTEQNRHWLDRLQIDCSAQQFQPPSNLSDAQLSVFLGDAGSVELSLGRTAEAEADLQRSEILTPEDPSVRLALAHIYQSEGKPDWAERELSASISLRPDSETLWVQLATLYLAYRRLPEAQRALMIASQLANTPATDLALLGQIDLILQERDRALKDLDKAESVARRAGAREDEFPGLFAEIAAGRAMFYFDARDWKRAIAYQQEATRDTPDSSQAWQSLADICQAAGELELAAQARARASALTNSQ